jgi:hypothetical protein
MGEETASKKMRLQEEIQCASSGKRLAHCIVTVGYSSLAGGGSRDVSSSISNWLL